MKRRIQVVLTVVPAFGVLAAVALAAASPSVVTGDARHISETSAVLRGTVNPNGSGTTYYFQWGLDANYGVQSKSVSAGSGTKNMTVQATAGDLIPGTTYHFRLVASNRFGVTVGADRTFTTAGHPPPSAATGPATQITSSGATLTGVINPQSEQTSWAFQYGLTASYTSQTLSQTVAAVNTPQSIATPLPGLAPGTIYHYRLVASHGGTATSYGADAQFMTFPRRRPVPRVRARTRPHVASHRPFVLISRGSVGHPGWIPAAYACNGNVSVRFLHGSRQVGLTFVALAPNCTFSARTVFRHLPGHGHHRPPAVLQVRVRFLGNGYLAPDRARNETVTLR